MSAPDSDVSVKPEALPPLRKRGVAWLRYERAGVERSANSDWDLAVRDLAEANRELEASAGPPDLRIERQYVVQRHYPWGEVDFLPVFEWNGIEYLDRDRFWARVERGADGLVRPCLAHDAFICWMGQVLWGARYREKYDRLLAAAWQGDGAEFFHCLEGAFGRAWARVLAGWLEEGTPGRAAEEAKGLRRALAWRALERAPGECLWRQARHWWVEWKNHVRPPFPWVAVLGPDGSGKSSVVEGVTRALAERRLKVRMLHWRPQLLWKAASVPGGIVTDPHGKPPRGSLISTVKLAALGAEWWIAHFGRLRHLRAKDSILMSDRYFADLLVDQRRYRYGAPLSWAKRAFRLFPKPDRVIFLLADAPTIRARKQEVAYEELERQLAEYHRLAGSMGDRAAVVDAGRPLEEVVRRVMEEVIRACRETSAEGGRRKAGYEKRETREETGGEESPGPPSAIHHSPSTVAGRIDAGDEVRAGLRVLVSAYACSPVRGAEANVAWNLVRELSQRHELWVLTREINRQAIEGSGEEWTGRVRWVYLDPPRALSFWRRGNRGIPPFYLWWQWLARKRARALLAERSFDVIHHVTFGTYLVPSPLSDLGVPLVFGPVGGGEETPAGLAGEFRLAGRWEEFLRRVARSKVGKVGVFRHWYQATAWTLAATPATREALERLGVRRLSMMPQSATGGDAVERFVREHPERRKRHAETIRLITASRLVHWKAVDMAVEAVSLARAKGLDVCLTILQEGPELEALKRHVRRSGMEDVVEFAGRLPDLEEVFQRMVDSDALLHPALHEAFGQACLEALALGVPVICLDWGGPGMIVDEGCGFKVEPGDRAGTVAALAEAIVELAARKRAGEDFSAAARERAKRFQWSRMREEIEGYYRRVMAEAKESA